MNKHIKIIMIQAIIIAFAFSIIYFAYPKTNAKLEGNVVEFGSINSRGIIISQNPDFSNSKHIEFNGTASIMLNPGTYYWKSTNGIIDGFEKKITIESEVGMIIEDNESNLINVGNVKINVTKNREGMMVGHIILGPQETEKIEIKENDTYIGRQEQ